MHILKPVRALILATSALLFLGIGAASAGGSIGLDEVMEQLKDNATLIDELNTELKAQNLKPEDVICGGARFGNQWTHLGGARAIPFNCKIGSRTIDIDGDLHVYDAAGKDLDMDADDTPALATTYKQLNLTWQWS